MFDLGWSEIILISAVTLIVVGPKEIPHVLRGCMRIVGKVRGLVREFQSGVDDVVRQVDIDEFKEYKKTLNNQADDLNSIGADFKKDWNTDWDAELKAFESDSVKAESTPVETQAEAEKTKQAKAKKTAPKKIKSKKSKTKKSVTKKIPPKKSTKGTEA